MSTIYHWTIIRYFGRSQSHARWCGFILNQYFLLAIAHNMHQFLMERIFQGMGVCFIGTIGYATLQEIFNDTDAVKLTALMSSISIISPLLGPSQAPG